MNIQSLFGIAAVTIATGLGAAPLDYPSLRVGDAAHGFRTGTVYLDAADRPMGARFLHDATGFQLDLLRIESVPQAFTWVKSFATSDMGEPHTQEHLLLLRGIRGRTLATRKSMSLASSSAYTETWRTSYFFNTTAGLDTFFDVFAEQQRAMLHPDYSDAEIALEVRNVGVARGADGRLRLEEKGTVYNEMLASMSNGSWRAWRAMFHAVYGRAHPLGYNQGGDPDAIRRMGAQDIRRFHAATHHLGNMGSVVALPSTTSLDEALARFNRTLMRDAPPNGRPRPADRLEDLPPPAGDPEGAMRLYDYPHANAAQPSPMSLVWPAQRQLDAGEQLLLELFLGTFAGDVGTNLYTLLIDSTSRKHDIGARSVGSYMPGWGGFPVAISLADVRPAAMDDAGLNAIRALVVGELQRVAAWAPDSPELAAFNARLANRVSARERELTHFLGTPPGFGARGTSAAWANLVHQLERAPGDRKSLALKPQFEAIRAMLAQGGNPWRERLNQWRILGVQPYIVGARPSPALIASEQAERDARLRDELQALLRRKGTSDDQAALAQLAKEHETELARIDAATHVPPLPFVREPPMGLDEGLRHQTLRLANDVPLVASRFDSMTGASVALALRADTVPDDELRALSVLPELLTRSGVRLPDGSQLGAAEVSERLRRELLSLDAGFSTNPRNGRVELVMRATGVGRGESERALSWMGLMLSAPDWRPANLRRVRDVVDQHLASLRGTMQRPEEAWVNDPANAWRQQDNPAWLAAAAFHTRIYNTLRLRWQLMAPAAADAQAMGLFLEGLAQAARTKDRAAVKALLQANAAPGFAALAPTAQALAREALRDLDLALSDMPDASLQADLRALCAALRADLALPQGVALARLESLRQRLLAAGGARLALASSEDLRVALMPALQGLGAQLRPGPLQARARASEGLIGARLRERGAEARPVHVGLYAPNKQGGVILAQAPLVSYDDAQRPEALLDYLSTRLYGGGGSHGVFSKTVGAGLAYSNGLGASPSSGHMSYYAERTPQLPQTVRFAIDVVKNSPPDPALGEYVMAQAFGESRAAQSYEARAAGMASDLIDGQTPEQVRALRQALLRLRQDPKLVDLLYARKDRVHARLFPGYATTGLDRERGRFMVIGPERQLDAWEAYLRESEGPAAKLQRLYGRDFWMP